MNVMWKLLIFIINVILITIILTLIDYGKEIIVTLLLWIMVFFNQGIGKLENKNKY